jgi:hypothetical protein
MYQFVGNPAGRAMAVTQLLQGRILRCTFIERMGAPVPKMAAERITEGRRHLAGNGFKATAVGRQLRY